jgi:hypothetical protein
MSWYSAIARDITKIPTAIAFFESEILDAKRECNIVGNVEKAAASMLGLV